MKTDLPECSWFAGEGKNCLAPAIVAFRSASGDRIPTRCRIGPAARAICPTRSLQNDSRRLAALVEGLRGLFADWTSPGRVDILDPVDCTDEVEALLLAHGFGPES